MEYKIGQIFEMDGIWYQFVKDDANGCKNCEFYYYSKIKCAIPDEDVRCSKWHREDGNNGHFVRLLPLGKVYEQGGDKWQQYKCIEKPNTEDKRVYIAHTDSEVGLSVSIRLTSLNDMKSEMAEIKNENLSNTEKIGKNLREFDLEAAKSGKPVCTRDGRKARIICFDRVTNSTNEYTGSLVVLITNPNGDEQSWYYTDKGILAGRDEYDNHKYDLMMLPEKKEGWVNLYRDEESKRVYCWEFIFSEREKAEKHYECNDTKVATVPVNWEE